ncbi:MAG TPA: MFS transporter [Humibacter sp.]|jgi:hypothetical protein|nr:MFS transporter [Humibacter sp.]
MNPGRALLRWQLIAIPVLPLWLLIGYGIFGGGAGGFFLLFLGSAVLFAFQAVIAGLTRLRPRVRERRALGGWDAAALVVWHLALIGLGFFGATGVAFGVASVVLGLGVFWLTVWELTREWRNRVSGAVAEASAAPRPTRRPGDDGDVIIVHEGGH